MAERLSLDSIGQNEEHSVAIFTTVLKQFLNIP
jgi:hypothetical protein